jgi:hypothetical protein
MERPMQDRPQTFLQSAMQLEGKRHPGHHYRGMR